MGPHREEGGKKNAAQFASNDSFGSCPTCGSSGHFCVHCGKKVLASIHGCQTCGVPKFCIYCGHPTERMMKMDENKMNMNTPKAAYEDVMQMQSMNMMTPKAAYEGVMQMQPMMSMPMMQMPFQTNASPFQSQGSQVMTPEGTMLIPVSVPFQHCLQGYPASPG